MRISAFLSGKKPLCIGLPCLNHRIAQWCASAVKDLPGQRDALAFNLPVDHPAAQILWINASDPGKVRRAADVHIRTSGLAGGFREILHHSPSIRFSNIVCRRPRRVMSKR